MLKASEKPAGVEKIVKVDFVDEEERIGENLDNAAADAMLRKGSSIDFTKGIPKSKLVKLMDDQNTQ